jgi:hypothetical protein
MFFFFCMVSFIEALHSFTKTIEKKCQLIYKLSVDILVCDSEDVEEPSLSLGCKYLT